MWDLGDLKVMLLVGCAYTASAVDAEGNSDTTGSGAVFEICVRYAGFIDGVTISTSVFLFIWSCLICLAGGYLLFVLGAIVKDNKIDYKDNNGKIRTTAR